jgi:hypothetical protein
VGLFISSAGFQAGAYSVVKHTNVHLLDWHGFEEMFAERWCERYWVPTLRDRVSRLASYVEPMMSDAVIRFEQGTDVEPAEAVGMLVSDMWGPPFLSLPGLAAGDTRPLVPAIWRHRDMYRKHMPREVAEANTLRELIDNIITFYDRWLRETGRV